MSKINVQLVFSNDENNFLRIVTSEGTAAFPFRKFGKKFYRTSSDHDSMIYRDAGIDWILLNQLKGDPIGVHKDPDMDFAYFMIKSYFVTHRRLRSIVIDGAPDHLVERHTVSEDGSFMIQNLTFDSEDVYPDWMRKENEKDEEELQEFEIKVRKKCHELGIHSPH